MDWVKQNMHQARLQRSQLRMQGAVTDAAKSLGRDSAETGGRLSDFFSVTYKLPWLVAGMALGGVIVTMVWKSGLVGVSESLRVNGIPSGMSEQHSSLDELPAQFTATYTEGLRNDIALLTEQVQTLNTSVSDLKIKLQSIHTMTDSIAALGNELAAGASQQPGAVSATVTQLETLPSLAADTVSQLEAPPSRAADTVTQLEALPSPAAGSGNVSGSIIKDADKLGDASSTTLAVANVITPAAPGIQTRGTVISKGPWVINLASIPNKVDAEHFMEKAQSRGVAAGLYQVTVKGTDYWRVQVSGFSSAAEAKSAAGLIKEKLGLKDLWIAKQ